MGLPAFADAKAGWDGATPPFRRLSSHQPFPLESVGYHTLRSVFPMSVIAFVLDGLWHVILQQGQAEVAKMLIDSGAPLEARNTFGDARFGSH
jgi:hypothetical protein